MTLNIFINNSKSAKALPQHKADDNVIYYFNRDYTESSEETLYERLFKELKQLLDKAGKDFSRLGRVRVVIRESSLDQSVTFRMTDENKFGVFKNWVNGNNISPKMWNIWFKLNNYLLDLEEVA
ncbi:hypothetical protein [Campylobacter sp. MIT 97-5078]|uniref:hypothetical protein n=1 Tax=Campylobacter sp. MIT 97-5078 TaxID=1548153 RepID=UPI0005135737|nr:hypothetical protein [Campylobacter sp. MIT 97-5078]KGI55443.1 hypothetical protein LR59_12005 [Campylobacter sp. MIT 97-5078]KGI57352.1 hypothetical protein LR59_01075 [Campylobacter sp. MIT 97-5078]TQR27438.1 hypothetical protein DMB91_04060 [Campylobacter sp. MIT 97-5078]